MMPDYPRAWSRAFTDPYVDEDDLQDPRIINQLIDALNERIQVVPDPAQPGFFAGFWTPPLRRFALTPQDWALPDGAAVPASAPSGGSLTFERYILSAYALLQLLTIILSHSFVRCFDDRGAEVGYDGVATAAGTSAASQPGLGGGFGAVLVDGFTPTTSIAAQFGGDPGIVSWPGAFGADFYSRFPPPTPAAPTAAAGFTRLWPREIHNLSDAGEEGQVARYIYANSNRDILAGDVGGIHTTDADWKQLTGRLFRHTSGAWVAAPDASLPDILSGVGPIHEGDILGAWIVNDLRRAIDCLRWTYSGPDRNFLNIDPLSGPQLQIDPLVSFSAIAGQFPFGLETGEHFLDFTPYLGLNPRFSFSFLGFSTFDGFNADDTNKVVGLRVDVSMLCGHWTYNAALSAGAFGVFTQVGTNQFGVPIFQVSARPGAPFALLDFYVRDDPRFPPDPDQTPTAGDLVHPGHWTRFAHDVRTVWNLSDVVTAHVSAGPTVYHVQGAQPTDPLSNIAIIARWDGPEGFKFLASGYPGPAGGSGYGANYGGSYGG